jgi:hypothetical protein
MNIGKARVGGYNDTTARGAQAKGS